MDEAKVYSVTAEPPITGLLCILTPRSRFKGDQQRPLWNAFRARREYYYLKETWQENKRLCARVSSSVKAQAGAQSLTADRKVQSPLVLNNYNCNWWFSAYLYRHRQYCSGDSELRFGPYCSGCSEFLGLPHSPPPGTTHHPMPRMVIPSISP
jgi:hypothetical protein